MRVHTQADTYQYIPRLSSVKAPRTQESRVSLSKVTTLACDTELVETMLRIKKGFKWMGFTSSVVRSSTHGSGATWYLSNVRDLELSPLLGGLMRQVIALVDGIECQLCVPGYLDRNELHTCV